MFTSAFSFFTSRLSGFLEGSNCVSLDYCGKSLATLNKLAPTREFHVHPAGTTRFLREELAQLHILTTLQDGEAFLGSDCDELELQAV